MNKPIIKFENVSKRYRIGSGRGSLRDMVTSLPLRLFNRDEHGSNDANELWALKDVSFEVRRGEALGIIGPNGAGKTTILKLLAGITRPTSGHIKANGRIGALIELGAGFHPDLTGRENIYLNGVILGLSRKEIARRLDSIVQFAEIETFIDTPVKRYSSGMYVRLGFSVAVHTDPDVLLIDEVLAVGDTSFQRKCMERVKELQRCGIPIVFISHNLYHVQAVCTRALLLMGGRIAAFGETSQVIQEYETHVQEEIRARMEKGLHSSPLPNSPVFKGSDDLSITGVQLLGEGGREQYEFSTGERLIARVSYLAQKRLERPHAVLRILRSDGVTCCMCRTSHANVQTSDIEGTGFFEAEIDPLQLNSGVYVLEARILNSSESLILAICRSRPFKVEAPILSLDETTGVFFPFLTWRQSTRRKMASPESKRSSGTAQISFIT